MKPTHILLYALTLGATSGGLRAQQKPAPADALPDPSAAQHKPVYVKYALLLPNDKSAERVKDTERNPFGKNEEVKHFGREENTNEENLIRDNLLKLRVAGASSTDGGTRIMLGDMILRTGQAVPAVLPDQTLELQVGNISPESIELIWVEKKSSGPQRTMIIPIDLRPKIRYRLLGQPDEKEKLAKKTGPDPKQMGKQALPLSQGFLSTSSDRKGNSTPASAKPGKALTSTLETLPEAAPPAATDPVTTDSVLANPAGALMKAVGFITGLAKPVNETK